MFDVWIGGINAMVVLAALLLVLLPSLLQGQKHSNKTSPRSYFRRADGAVWHTLPERRGLGRLGICSSCHLHGDLAPRLRCLLAGLGDCKSVQEKIAWTQCR